MVVGVGLLRTVNTAFKVMVLIQIGILTVLHVKDVFNNIIGDVGMKDKIIIHYYLLIGIMIMKVEYSVETMLSLLILVMDVVLTTNFRIIMVLKAVI